MTMGIHAFDIGHAQQYGIEEAILIAHMIHWIGVNQRLGKNYEDGRTWTYQTNRQIQAHFPYMTPDSVRRTIESLIRQGVLITGQYNRKSFDKTKWYALQNEEMFTIGKNARSIGENARSIGENARPIPDNLITDTKEKLNTPISPKGGSSASADGACDNKSFDRCNEEEMPEEITDLGKELLQKAIDILEAENPTYRPPKAAKQRAAMGKHLQAMLDDGQDFSTILRVLQWAVRDKTKTDDWCGWSAALYSKDPIGRFRKHYSKLYSVMTSKKERKFAPCSDDNAAYLKMLEMEKYAL